MNIFKILANGDGSINEPNISAFLGYMLDPYQDHGLGHEFLKRFLGFVHNEEKINFYAYDYEIELEQAFREGDKSKQIVDIVIACFPSQRKNLKESITIETVQSVRNLERIYLIENKVTYNAKKAEQLKNQFNSTIETLKLNHDKVFPIYLTPDIKTYHDEFDSFNAEKKKHFVWIYENELPLNNLEEENTEVQNLDNSENLYLVNNSIYKIIKDIISDESKGQIEAINEYTKHTLISFAKFIENEFKSEIQEEKERKNDGSYTEKYRKINEESKIEVKLTKLREELIKRDINLDKILSNPNLIDPRSPCLKVTLNNITIKLYAGAKARNTISFLFQADKDLTDSKLQLSKISKSLNLEIKKEKYDDAYCRTKEMREQISIIDFDSIFNALNTLIKTVQNA